MIDISKYTFTEGYTKDRETGEKTIRKVVALATYAGKPVRGVAKLNPGDKYSLSSGMELAAARCNLKIAEKRQARAIEKYNEAVAKLNEARQYLNAMSAYYTDSAQAVKAAKIDLEEILNSPRAKAIYDGFSNREAMEPLCRRCGYARRFG